ncbi:hypothetical protein R70199_08175 [Paraburkholderia domus]|nr:hypothetical protein R70199_08175 [Paraburkholderia domus]
MLGQRAHHRKLEDRAQRKLAMHRLPDACHQSCGQQRVTAEAEKIVRQPDPGHAEQLGDDRAKRVVLRRARRQIGDLALPHGLRRNAGQCSLVDLAVVGQRQHVKRNKKRRDHGIRQAPHQSRAQVIGVDPRTATRDHVSGQAQTATRPRRRQHGRLRHVGMRRQDCLDLARLDPHAANLDLIVGTAAILEQAVAPPDYPVAGPVEPLAGDKRTRDEARGRQACPAQITPRQAHARYIELAPDTGRARPQPVVQHIGAEVRVGSADRHVLPVHLRRYASDGGFGRTVFVDDADTGAARPDQVGLRLSQRLAADDGHPDRRGSWRKAG